MTTRTFLQFPLIKIILGISVCMLAFVGVQNFISKPFFYHFIQDKNIADPFIHLISIVVLIAVYYFFFHFYDQRKITELSIAQLPKEMLGGLILGFALISISIFSLYLLNHYQILHISMAHYSLRLFGILLVAALIEDLLTRGLIIRELEQWLGTHTCLVIGIVIETWHYFNPNSNGMSLFMNVAWGFTMTMLFVYSKRIWLPYFFHVGWNFAQPFYGSNLTGIDSMGTIIDSKFTGPVWLTGGAFGIEGSVITIFLLWALGILLYYFAYKKGRIVKKSISKKTVIQ